MSKKKQINNRIVSKIIFTILIISMLVCLTACDFQSVATDIIISVNSVYNSLVNDLSHAEWGKALNRSNFNNVILLVDGEEIKIVNGQAYVEGKAIDLEEWDTPSLMLKLVMGIINNSYKDDFTYDSKNNVYCANKTISCSFTSKIEGINVNLYCEASNLMLLFDDNKNLNHMLCNIVVTMSAMEYEETLGVEALKAEFYDYGNTSITK